MLRSMLHSRVAIGLACCLVLSLFMFTPAFAGDELPNPAATTNGSVQMSGSGVSSAAQGAANVEAAGAAGATGAGVGGITGTTGGLIMGGAMLGTAAVLGTLTSAGNDNETTAHH